MKKKDVLLVLVVILIPIVLLGALAVMGADNIKPSVSFEGEEGAYTVYKVDDGVVTSENITDGAEAKKDTDVTFAIMVNEGYSGAPVVSVDGQELTPDSSANEDYYIYTVTVDSEPVTVNISGLTKTA